MIIILAFGQLVLVFVSILGSVHQKPLYDGEKETTVLELIIKQISLFPSDGIV